MVDAISGRVQRRNEQLPASAIALFLSSNVCIIIECSNHRNLDWPRLHHACVLTNVGELRNQCGISGNKCCTVSSQVGLLAQGIRGENSSEIATGYLWIKQTGNRFVFPAPRPAQFGITLVTDDVGPEFSCSLNTSLELFFIENLSIWITGAVEPDQLCVFWPLSGVITRERGCLGHARPNLIGRIGGCRVHDHITRT